MSFGKSPRLYRHPTESEYAYAGTMDLKCKMLPTPEHSKKLIYLIDFKTGSRLKGDAKKKGYNEWPLQTASYRNTDITIQGNGVVHLCKEDGAMSWFDYSKDFYEDFAAFAHLCRYWRNRNADLLQEEGGLPSSTTILGVLDKPALRWWAVNSMRDYLFDKLKKKTIFWIWRPDLFPIIEEARKNFRKVSKKALDIGSQVHEAIEAYFKEGVEPSSNASDEVISSFVAFLDWVDAHEVEPIEVEKVVYGKL